MQKSRESHITVTFCGTGRVSVGARMWAAKAAALTGAALLASCADFGYEWSDRYGPPPVPTSADVAQAATRELQIVAALAYASGLPVKDGSQTFPTQRAGWYGMILTGFNTVDDACATYINDLWKLDRQRGRVKDTLTATGSAVAAIIGANSHPSTATLTILAQAFGLGTALTNALADSYLYAQTPSTVRTVVKKSKDAYRNDLATNFANSSYPVESTAAVYYHIREYLSLCLPPTIQSQIDDLVANAKATPEGSSASQKIEAAKQGSAQPPTPGSTRPKAATNILLR